MDEALRMDTIGKVSLSLVETIVSSTNKLSFREIEEAHYHLTIYIHVIIIDTIANINEVSNENLYKQTS